MLRGERDHVPIRLSESLANMFTSGFDPRQRLPACLEHLFARSLREIPSICETAKILKSLNVHGYSILCKKRTMYGKYNIGLAKQLPSNFYE
jgi:hypothetical protein